MIILKYTQFNERFSPQTLKSNNKIYSKYLKKNKDNSRSSIVAWDEPNSQEKNFKLVSKYVSQNDSLLDYGCGIGDLITFLKSENKQIGNYLGVDINPEFIEIAEKSYPDNNFQLIKNIDELSGSFDIVCAVGVFTWFITKTDFIKTLHKLYEIANKQILITCLYDEDADLYHRWTSNYNDYNEKMFKNLFPKWKIESEVIKDQYGIKGTILIRIIK